MIPELPKLCRAMAGSLPGGRLRERLSVEPRPLSCTIGRGSRSHLRPCRRRRRAPCAHALGHASSRNARMRPRGGSICTRGRGTERAAAHGYGGCSRDAGIGCIGEALFRYRKSGIAAFSSRPSLQSFVGIDGHALYPRRLGLLGRSLSPAKPTRRRRYDCLGRHRRTPQGTADIGLMAVGMAFLDCFVRAPAVSEGVRRSGLLGGPVLFDGGRLPHALPVSWELDFRLPFVARSIQGHVPCFAR
jgi:hypothetical protein